MSMNSSASAKATAFIDEDLLPLLACPLTHRPLLFEPGTARLIEPVGGTSYAVRDGIPLLVAPTTDAGGGGSAVPDAAYASAYDTIIQSPQMRQLYGDSGYFNVGLWTDPELDLAQACDALVDRLASGIDDDARVILDVGCGVGAGSVRLATLRPDASVIGVNISPWQLAQARNRGLACVVASDAARLGFGDAVANAVTACESPQHFNTRAAFFDEAFRVLKPGGTIALADMLVRDREPIGDWMLPVGNPPLDPAGYGALLAHAGFGDIAVADVTGRTWTPYCRRMAQVFVGNEARAARIEQSLAHYVIAFARKPLA